MNVYQKLAKARLKLKTLGLKPTGKNKGLNYTYFDLIDILPHTTVIEDELGLLSLVTFTETEGKLTVLNTEKPEETIEFTSPLRDAKVGTCQPVQNLGAIETYVRRYLYLLAYEIVETEALDLAQVSENKGQNKAQEGRKAQPSADRKETPQNANNAVTERTEQPAEEDYEFPPESYKCAVCGKVITKKLFEQTLKKYGTPLCSAACRDFVIKAENV